jgi:hypothetical protein
MQAVKVVSAVFLGIILLVVMVALGAMIMLDRGVFNADFMVNQMERLDISELAGDTIAEQMLVNLPPEAAYIEDSLDELLIEVEPWIDAQAGIVIPRIYDYILGKTNSYEVSIPTVELEQILLDEMDVILAETPPEILTSVPAEMRPQIIAQIKAELAANFPDEIVINKAIMPAEFADMLEQARLGLSYFRMGYWATIGLTLFLALLIVLTFRSVRPASRTLGIVLLLFGLVEIAIFYGSQTALPYAPLNQLPVALRDWMPGLVEGLLQPVLMLGIGGAVVGVALIVLSALYRRESV